MNLNISILEDNQYFNKLITNQLNLYLTSRSSNSMLDFSVTSFTDSSEFRKKIEPDLNIAFIDYYLNQGVTGMQILKDIQYKCEDCKVVIISSARTIDTVILPITKGAYSFIYKDLNLIQSCCFYLENEVNRMLDSA